MKLLGCCREGFMNALDRGFGLIGNLITKRPVQVILASVLLSVIMGQGFHLSDFETSPEMLFTPKESDAVKDQLRSTQIFGEDPRLNEVYVTSIVQNKNIFTKEYLIAIAEFVNFIRNELTAEFESSPLRFHDVCYKGNTNCLQIDTITSIWNHNITLIDSKTDVQLQQDYQFPQNQETILPYSQFLSRLAITDNNVTTTPAIKITFLLSNDRRNGAHDDPYSKAFEVALYHRLLHSDWLFSQSHPSVLFHSFSFGVEEYINEQVVKENMPIMMIGYLMMIVYCCFYLGNRNWVKSHAFLGVISVLSVLLSTLTAFGIAWYIGVQYSPVVQVSILLLLGIGIDDSFIIMQTWHSQPPTTSLSQRMISSIKHSGSSILTTTITDLCAFLAGTATQIPAVRSFCIYAALGVVFDFLYQITFFTAVAYIDFKREASKRLDFFCCVKLKEDENKNCCFLGPSKTKNGTMSISKYTLSPVGQIIGIAVTVLLVVVASFGWQKVEMNFRKEWLTPENDSYQIVYTVRNNHFSGNNPQIYLYQTLDLVDFRYSEKPQLALLSLVNKTYDSNWVAPESHSIWYFSFVNWRGLGGVIPKYEFKGALEAFLDSKEGEKWQADVKIEGNIAHSRSRFLATHDSLLTGENSVDAMDDIRRVVKNIPECQQFNCYAHGRLFVFWEGTKIIIDEVKLNVTAASIAVAATALLLLGSPIAAGIVLCMVLMVDFLLFGFMPYVNCDFNTVTMVCIVLAVGLSVDSSLHIAHCFMSITVNETSYIAYRHRRACYALDSMGSPVLCAGFSTFVAVVPLYLSNSYIFNSFFKLLSMVLGFGLWMGIIVLPLLLTYWGPKPFPNARNIDDSSVKEDVKVPSSDNKQLEAPEGILRRGSSLSSVKDNNHSCNKNVNSENDKRELANCAEEQQSIIRLEPPEGILQKVPSLRSLRDSCRSYKKTTDTDSDSDCNNNPLRKSDDTQPVGDSLRPPEGILRKISSFQSLRDRSRKYNKTADSDSDSDSRSDHQPELQHSNIQSGNIDLPVQDINTSNNLVLSKTIDSSR